MRAAVADVHVLSGLEDLEEDRVLGEVRHHAQLDLRVVDRQEHPVLLGDERSSDLLAEIRADRDVHEVRVRARQPAGRRNRLVIGRVHPSVLGVDQWGQCVDVGVLELRQLAVVEKLLHEGVLVDELLESARIRGQPSLRPTRRLQPELVVEEHPQLRRRAEVDPLPGELVALGLELGDALLEIAAISAR